MRILSVAVLLGIVGTFATADRTPEGIVGTFAVDDRTLEGFNAMIALVKQYRDDKALLPDDKPAESERVNEERSG